MIPDQIPFLANIILVALTDDILSGSENAQLESIRSELNFKKGDFSKAIKIVEQGGYQLTPVGHFADQVKRVPSYWAPSCLLLRKQYQHTALPA